METLKYKSISNSVIFLQEKLKEWGYGVSINGVFDKSLELSVLKFQSDQGLSIDGIVGDKTWQKLMDDDAKKLFKLKLSNTDIMNASSKLDIDRKSGV